MIRRLAALVVVVGFFLPLVGGCRDKTASPTVKDKPPPPLKKQTPGGAPKGGTAPAPE